MMSTGAIAKASLVIVVALASSLVALAAPAGACSCAGGEIATENLVGEYPLAFVGRVTDTEKVRPVGDDRLDLRYDVVVDHAVKGVEDGDRVVLFGDSGGSSCGTQELDATGEPQVILSWDTGERFIGDASPACTRLPSVQEMLEFDPTLPATSPGAVSLLAVGRVGEAELISFDRHGNPLAYGDLPLSSGAPAICPGSEAVIQLEQTDRNALPDLVIRDLATLQVQGRIVLDTPDDGGESMTHHLASGASLHCRDREGLDAIAVLSWENASDEQTRVVRIRPGEDLATQFAAYRRASRARYDEHSESIVGVVDGTLSRLDLDGGEIEPIAQLVEEPPVQDQDAGFIHPDGQGGYWIGMGAVQPEYELVERVTTLVHATADGQVERWPIVRPIDPFYSPAFLRGQSLVSSTHRIPLPDLGSSAQGIEVRPKPLAGSNPREPMADGRVRITTQAPAPKVTVVDPTGNRATLQYLTQPRFAVSVSDGPTVDPTLIDLSPQAALLQSEWITDADGTPRAAAELPDSSAGGDTLWWILAIAATAAAAACIALFLAGRHRTSQSDSGNQ